MNGLFQGVILVALFIAGNVVAGGVVLVLGRILQLLAPGLESPWPWLAIGAAGALAAYAFIRGSLLAAGRIALLQWRPGRRGG